MAKAGLDYFPLDVTMDSKVELIEAEFGLTGFGVIVHLLQEIYGKAGYYIEWTNEVALLFARKVGLGGSAVSEIVEASIRRGMFDKELYDKYHVLTSKGIQKRYFEAVSRRKQLEVDYNILLVDCTIFLKSVDIKRVNVNILSKNADISKQSKVEESRVEESKVEESKVEDYTHIPQKPIGESLSAVAYFLDKVNPDASPRSLEELSAFVSSMGDEVCIAAMEIAMDEKKPIWSYVRGILRRWQREGVKCIADVKALDDRHEQGKADGSRSHGATKPQPGKPGEADQRARDDMDRLRKMMKEGEL